MRGVILILCLTIASCNSPGAPAAAPAQVRGPRFVAQELARCALWTDIPYDDVTKRKVITSVYENLAHYDNATIRNGISLYEQATRSNGWDNYNAGEKIFAFLRVVFDVPPRFDATKATLPYRLMGNPVQRDGVDLLWPFSQGDDGRLLLTGVDLPFHTGTPYDPIADFDQMASRLGRRFPVGSSRTD